jgi:hypothetical protein
VTGFGTGTCIRSPSGLAAGRRSQAALFHKLVKTGRLMLVASFQE